MSAVVVDAHAHVFAPVSERFPRDVHELFPAAAEASAEQLLEAMEAAGVDRAVLVPLSPHDEYLRDVLERHPHRFAAVGVQPPGPVDLAAHRQRRERVGLQGLRLFSLGDPGVASPEEAESFELLAELEQDGDKLWFYGGGAQMELLRRMLELLPDLAVVLNHLGYWPVGFHAGPGGQPRFGEPYGQADLEAVRALARFPRVHVLCAGMYAFATTPCPYDDLRPVTAGLLEAYGPSRLLRGSDFPWVASDPGYGAALAAVDDHLASLAGPDLDLVRGLNAAALFHF